MRDRVSVRYIMSSFVFQPIPFGRARFSNTRWRHKSGSRTEQNAFVAGDDGFRVLEGTCEEATVAVDGTVVQTEARMVS